LTAWKLPFPPGFIEMPRQDLGAGRLDPGKDADAKRREIMRKQFVLTAVLILACLTGITTLTGAQETAKPKATEVSTGPMTGALVDLNSATPAQLQELPEISEEYARKIIDGRPYSEKTDLVKKKVIPQAIYDSIAERVIAKRIGKKPPK
jgi:competence protein ComEA